jgi:hypothetical protein
MTSGTINIVKSVGTIVCYFSHLKGIDTVAEIVGVAEKIDAMVFPLAF